MQPKRNRALHTKRRVGALDGLRAAAILAILAYHLNLPWLPSGNLGVVMFLVLAGYLGTMSIVRAHERSAGITPVGLVRLWWRRLLRLWPSVFALVAVVAALCTIADHVLLTKMRPDVLPSLGMYLNWAYIANGSSYFSQIGGPSPLLHLWYLGVDIQFFVVWSIILAITLRVGKRGSRCVALLLCIASATWMALCYNPAADPTRVYYGTDTRAFSLLLGGWLALAFPLGKTPVIARSLLMRQTQPAQPRHASQRQKRRRGGVATAFAHVAGLFSLAALVALMAYVPRDTPLWYYGGMLLASVLCVILIACALVPGSAIGALLALPPLRFIGTRSYALYLWHFPIFQLLSANKTVTPWEQRLAAVLLSVVAAELSYWFVEKSFAGALRLRRASTTEPMEETQDPSATARAEAPTTEIPREPQERRMPGGLFARLAIGSLAVSMAAGYGACGLLFVPDQTLVPEEAIVSTGESADQARDLLKERREAAAAESNQPESSDDMQQESQGSHASSGTATHDPISFIAQETASMLMTQIDTSTQVAAQDAQELTEQQAQQEAEEAARRAEESDTSVIHAPASEKAKYQFDPVLIGDSVPGDADWSVRLPDSLIDSFVGRRPDQAITVLQGYLAQGVVGKVVVFACFSNVTPLPEQLDTMVQLLGEDRQVYLVGTVNPDGFQDAANANLMDAAERYDNVHYVDWPATCAGHEAEYLWADATHLRPEGSVVYVNMVTQAIAKSMVDAGGTVE